MASERTDLLQAGGWTFIDRGQEIAFEEISERKAKLLRALYRERGWRYEVVDPEGRAEVFDGDA